MKNRKNPKKKPQRAEKKPQRSEKKPPKSPKKVITTRNMKPVPFLLQEEPQISNPNDENLLVKRKSRCISNIAHEETHEPPVGKKLRSSKSSSPIIQDKTSELNTSVTGRASRKLDFDKMVKIEADEENSNSFFEIENKNNNKSQGKTSKYTMKGIINKKIKKQPKIKVKVEPKLEYTNNPNEPDDFFECEMVPKVKKVGSRELKNIKNSQKLGGYWESKRKKYITCKRLRQEYALRSKK